MKSFVNTCILPLFVALIGLHGPASANAAVVHTLYAVQQQIPSGAATLERFGTTIYSNIGPGENGATRYQVEEVYTKEMLFLPTMTSTHTHEPSTILYTVEQAASSYHANIVNTVPVYQGQVNALITLDINCTMNLERNTGECVDVNVIPDATLTSRYTGSLLPYATITASAGHRASGTDGFTYTIVALFVTMGSLAGSALLLH